MLERRDSREDSPMKGVQSPVLYRETDEWIGLDCISVEFVRSSRQRWTSRDTVIAAAMSAHTYSLTFAVSYVFYSHADIRTVQLGRTTDRFSEDVGSTSSILP